MSPARHYVYDWNDCLDTEEVLFTSRDVEDDEDKCQCLYYISSRWGWQGGFYERLAFGGFAAESLVNRELS